MPTYHVHLYRQMRLAYTNVEAETPETAVMIARDFAERKEQPVAEDCDGETFAALVDVVGDEDFSQSQTIDFEAGRLFKAAPKLLAAILSILPYAENELASLRECQRRDDGLEEEVMECEQRIAQAWKMVERAEGRAA